MIDAFTTTLSAQFIRDNKDHTISIGNTQEVFIVPRSVITKEDEEITEEFKACIVLMRALFAVLMGLVANRLLQRNSQIVTDGIKDIISRLKNISTEKPN